jgi:hypothetical protein
MIAWLPQDKRVNHTCPFLAAGFCILGVKISGLAGDK